MVDKWLKLKQPSVSDTGSASDEKKIMTECKKSQYKEDYILIMLIVHTYAVYTYHNKAMGLTLPLA